eukprot:499603_1
MSYISSHFHFSCGAICSCLLSFCCPSSLYIHRVDLCKMYAWFIDSIYRLSVHVSTSSAFLLTFILSSVCILLGFSPKYWLILVISRDILCEIHLLLDASICSACQSNYLMDSYPS